MGDKSRALAYASLSVAVGVIVLALGSLLPAARLALLCVSSLGVVLMALRFGRGWALGVFGGTALLSLLLVPGKMLALAYLLLPGWYPVVKLRLERLAGPVRRFGAKLLLAAALLLLALWLGRDMLAAYPLPAWVLFAEGLAVFLVYDYALTQIILLYMRKIAGRIK